MRSGARFGRVLFGISQLSSSSIALDTDSGLNHLLTRDFFQTRIAEADLLRPKVAPLGLTSDELLRVYKIPLHKRYFFKIEAPGSFDFPRQ